MANLEIKTYMVSAFSTNCYFVINQDSKETLVIDPGDQAQMLSQRIRDQKLIPVGVLLTHGHLDHAGAARELAKEFGIEIYAHEAEKKTLADPRMNLTASFGASESYDADVFLKDGEELQLLDSRICVLFTPGHTPGGCCYYFPEHHLLFSGDTLFCESVGRTDFPGGSSSVLVRSIQEKLLCLPDDTRVYPGHMGETMMKTEKMYNPFLF